ncbi:uncharacterized protein [Arachis hypogaea]|uniref:uncharacterized protein n=1 Tax=Arachis hypogaea TaxID=3818 RepID=UPI003B223AAF
MIVFAWNVRGIANRATVRALKEYRRMYRPYCFFLFETRCSGEKEREVIRELGFQFAVVEGAAWFSGGIWVLLEDANLNIRLRKFHQQYIHPSVDKAEWGSCLLTAVYASPQERHRATLWKKLRVIADPISIPWCKLIDLGWIGAKYTQKEGEREGQNRVFKRLDRGLSNIEWRTTFFDGRIEVLPRVRSDHHPLLARFVPSRVDVGEKPFRYETMWKTHPNFNYYVKEAWPRERKRRIMRRLEGIQQARGYGRIPYLDKLEKEFTEELELILEQEELMWQQRSRQKWITDGDRNTQFYHLKTVQRRRKNRICKLKGEDGRWCEDMEDLKHKAISYFKIIYNKDWMEEPIKITDETYPPIHEDNIVVNRIKPTLVNRIAPFQSSFIQGRLIQDNIIIAKEMVHDMKKMRGKKFMVIKVDFEKAYDRLRWDFILDCLHEFGIPHQLIDIIMCSVTSVSFKIIWNGCKTESFEPCRGLRQGNPISPYFFVIAMDKLSQVIEERVQLGV